jgi:hypothetical protein
MRVRAPKRRNYKMRYTEEEVIFIEHQTLLNLVAYNAETLKYIKKYGRFPPEVRTKRARAHLSRRLKLNGLIIFQRKKRARLTEKCHELLAQVDQP